MSIEKELETVQLELQNASARSMELNSSIGILEQQIKDDTAELKELVGTGWCHDRGTIGRLKSEIVDLKLKINHQTKPKVVWAKKETYNEGRIVSKVTAKRIYVCLPGNTNCDTYNKDGTAVSSWSGANSINIEATFGGPCPEKMV